MLRSTIDNAMMVCPIQCNANVIATHGAQKKKLFPSRSAFNETEKSLECLKIICILSDDSSSNDRNMYESNKLT